MGKIFEGKKDCSKRGGKFTVILVFKLCVFSFLNNNNRRKEDEKG